MLENKVRQLTDKPIENPKSVVKQRGGKFVVAEAESRLLRTAFWVSLYAFGGVLFAFYGLLNNRNDPTIGLDLGPKVAVSEFGYLTVGDLLLGMPLCLLLPLVLWLIWREDGYWQPYRLWLDQPQLLRGARQRLNFERRFRLSQAALGHEATITGRLVCQEVTKKGSGDDTWYSHTTLYTLPLPEVKVPAAAQGLSAEWDIDLPADVPPSQRQKNHWTAWKVQVIAEWGEKEDQTAQADFVVEVR